MHRLSISEVRWLQLYMLRSADVCVATDDGPLHATMQPCSCALASPHMQLEDPTEVSPTAKPENNSLALHGAMFVAHQRLCNAGADYRTHFKSSDFEVVRAGPPCTRSSSVTKN